MELVAELDEFVEGNEKYKVFEDSKDIYEQLKKLEESAEHIRYEGCRRETLKKERRKRLGLLEKKAKKVMFGMAMALPLQYPSDEGMYSYEKEIDRWIDFAENKTTCPISALKNLAMSVYCAFKYGSKRPLLRKIAAGIEEKFQEFDKLEKRLHKSIEYTGKYLDLCNDVEQTMTQTRKNAYEKSESIFQEIRKIATERKPILKKDYRKMVKDMRENQSLVEKLFFKISALGWIRKWPGQDNRDFNKRIEYIAEFRKVINQRYKKLKKAV